MEETELLAKNVRPYFGRITVIESPVDEEQRESGLVLPLQHEDDGGVRRGIIVHVDEFYDDPVALRAYEKLQPGVVVYYIGGKRIRDVIVLNHNEIWAFEA